MERSRRSDRPRSPATASKTGDTSQRGSRVAALQRRLGNRAFGQLVAGTIDSRRRDALGLLRGAISNPARLNWLRQPGARGALGVGHASDHWERAARAGAPEAPIGDVKLRTDPGERAVVAALGARALTVGDEIWLGPGEAAGHPRLLAHELAHVAQQRTDPRAPTVQLDEAPNHPTHPPSPPTFDPSRLTGRATTCVVSHHQQLAPQQEQPPNPDGWDELRRFVAEQPPEKAKVEKPKGTPFPPQQKPSPKGQTIGVTATQDFRAPSPDGKPRTVYNLEFSRPIKPAQARQIVFGNAPDNVTGLTPRARVIDQDAPAGTHRVYSLELDGDSAPFVQPTIDERLRGTREPVVAIPPLEQQLPKWLPDGARAAILGGKVPFGGIHRFTPRNGPWGTAFVWHGRDEFGQEVYQIFEEYPEDPKFYLKYADGDSHNARLFAKVNARFNRDMRWFIVGEYDQPPPEKGAPPPTGLPPNPGAISPYEARAKLIEIYGEEFKQVIEAFVGVLSAGAGITSASSGMRQSFVRAEKEELLASAEAMLARPDPVRQRLRGVQRAWWDYEGNKSFAEWYKTEAPAELKGVAGVKSGFSSSTIHDAEAVLKIAEQEKQLAPTEVPFARLRALSDAYKQSGSKKPLAQWLKTDAPKALRGVAGEASNYRDRIVDPRLRGLLDEYKKSGTEKSLAEWLKTEAPKELRGVAGEASEFADAFTNQQFGRARAAYEEYTAGGGTKRFVDWWQSECPTELRSNPAAAANARAAPLPKSSNAQLQAYADAVNSNRDWTYKNDIPGGANMTPVQKSNLRKAAVAAGLIKQAPLKPGTRYADFEKAGEVLWVDELPENLWKATDDVQFRWLNKRLPGGEQPPGSIWHHSDLDGRMELTTQGPHQATSHSGGRSVGRWAEGAR